MNATDLTVKILEGVLSQPISTPIAKALVTATDKVMAELQTDESLSATDTKTLGSEASANASALVMSTGAFSFNAMADDETRASAVRAALASIGHEIQPEEETTCETETNQQPTTPTQPATQPSSE